jgi:predicted PurR-regulated permease PerM
LKEELEKIEPTIKEEPIPGDYSARKLKIVNILLLSLIVLVITAIVVLLQQFRVLDSIWKTVDGILFILLVPPLVAFVAAIIMSPLMRILRKIKVNGKIAAAICTLLFLTILVAALVGIGWALVELGKYLIEMEKGGEITRFIEMVNETLGFSIIELPPGETVASVINDWLLRIQTDGTLWEIVGRAFGTITNIFIVITTLPMFLFFMLKEADVIKKGTIKIIPKKYKPHYDALSNRFTKIGRSFIAGQFYDMVIIFLIFLAAFFAIGGIIPTTDIVGGVEFLSWGPFVFAAIIAFCNLIPYIGCIVGPLVPIVYTWAFFPSTWVFWAVLGVCLAVQLFDQIVLRTILFSKSASVHPLLLLVGMYIAGMLFGFLGFVLSVAIVGFVKEAVVYLYQVYRERGRKKIEKEESVE